MQAFPEVELAGLEPATSWCDPGGRSAAHRARRRHPDPPKGLATLLRPGAIAQLGVSLDRTQEVAGSSPASSTFKGPCKDASPVPSLAFSTRLLIAATLLNVSSALLQSLGQSLCGRSGLIVRG